MSHHDHAEPIPRVPLLMIGGVVLLALALAASTSLGLVARDAVPEASRAAAGTQASDTRSLFFRDGEDGAVLIDDAETGERVARVEPGTGGFIRSTVRGLVQVRRREGIGAATPFTLTAYDNGALAIGDPTTGETRELTGFGQDNSAAFAVLLNRKGD